MFTIQFLFGVKTFFSSKVKELKYSFTDTKFCLIISDS